MAGPCSQNARPSHPQTDSVWLAPRVSPTGRPKKEMERHYQERSEEHGSEVGAVVQ